MCIVLTECQLYLQYELCQVERRRCYISSVYELLKFSYLILKPKNGKNLRYSSLNMFFDIF